MECLQKNTKSLEVIKRRLKGFDAVDFDPQENDAMHLENAIKKSALKGQRQLARFSAILLNKAEEFMMDARMKRDKPYIVKILELEAGHQLVKTERLVDAEMIERVKELYPLFPNFREVIDTVLLNLVLNLHGQMPLHFEPLLLVGEPGIGKTEFMLSLASSIGVERQLVDASSMQGSFTLLGTEQHWANAFPGLISKLLIESEYANVLMQFDELDKVQSNSSNGGDPYAAFHALLESRTAKEFQDTCYGSDVTFDTSLISYVATANDLRCIPEPILSRFNVIKVEKPTPQQLIDITQRIHEQLLVELNISEKLDRLLDSQVLDALSLVPREVKRALKHCYGRVLEQGRSEITLDDLEFSGGLVLQSRKVNMGFY